MIAKQSLPSHARDNDEGSDPPFRYRAILAELERAVVRDQDLDREVKIAIGLPWTTKPHSDLTTYNFF
jgi:hypothetical protein